VEPPSAASTLRRPAREPVAARTSRASTPPRGEPGRTPAAEPAPPFEWLDLVLYPWGQKPDPRGYAVYARRPQPLPAPVILIETA
jgi:hypothetical protein